MEQILNRVNSNRLIIQNNEENKKRNEIKKITKLCNFFHYDVIPNKVLMEQANGIANRFRNIFVEMTSCVNLPDDCKYTMEKMNHLYEKPEVENLHQIWLNIYNEIKIIKSIRKQGKIYNDLTSCLNPGQLLQCDFYRALQTFDDHGFEIIHVKENLDRFCSRQSALTNNTFSFYVRKKNWMLKVAFFDDSDCVSGILRPKIIIDMITKKEYDGEDFYGWNSYEKNTKCMIKMFDIGYDAMVTEYFGHLIQLTNVLKENNMLVDEAIVNPRSCRYFCDYNHVKHTIFLPSIYHKKLYLHMRFADKIVLSFKEYHFHLHRNEKIGMHADYDKQRYYIIHFNNSEQIPQIIEIIKCFLTESNPTYKYIFIENDIEQTLDPLIEYINSIKKNCQFSISDNSLSDLYKGLIIDYNILLESKHFFTDEIYHPCIININIKYDKNIDDSNCFLSIKMHDRNKSSMIKIMNDDDDENENDNNMNDDDKKSANIVETKFTGNLTFLILTTINFINGMIL